MPPNVPPHTTPAPTRRAPPAPALRRRALTDITALVLLGELRAFERVLVPVRMREP